MTEKSIQVPLKVVLFDWGDTLMRVFPEYPGPMVAWPRVEAVPGVKEALEALHSKYILAVATNAGNSNASQVISALERVGLGSNFSEVFTAGKSGAAKPDPEYFHGALAAMGYSPLEGVMVGDSYPVDVLGARKAGLKAVWYNPGLAAVPALPPEQDGDLARMEDLPEMLEALHLPDVRTCRAWQIAEEMPTNIANHSNAVAGAAYYLALWLRQTGQTVDPVLAHRGGLLHDLDKFKTLHQGNRHGMLSFELLTARAQPELAEIALRHNLPSILDPHSGSQTWEQKLVFYADKLVEGDRLVPLSVRFQALKTRYPDYQGQIERCAPFVFALEDDLGVRLGQTPDKLIFKLSQLINQ